MSFPRPTDPKHEAVLRELERREPIFHRPPYGKTRRDFENMTDPEYWEVGASGRRYSREFVLEDLVRRGREPGEELWTKRDMQCLEIAPDNYLFTYTLEQGPRVTRRATLWRRSGSDWKILYHQGTIVSPEALP
jgi:hypothetical protein